MHPISVTNPFILELPPLSLLLQSYNEGPEGHWNEKHATTKQELHLSL